MIPSSAEPETNIVIQNRWISQSENENYLHGSVLHWWVLSVTGARAGLCNLQVGEVGGEGRGGGRGDGGGHGGRGTGVRCTWGEGLVRLRCRRGPVMGHSVSGNHSSLGYWTVHVVRSDETQKISENDMVMTWDSRYHISRFGGWGLLYNLKHEVVVMRLCTMHSNTYGVTVQLGTTYSRTIHLRLRLRAHVWTERKNARIWTGRDSHLLIMSLIIIERISITQINIRERDCSYQRSSRTSSMRINYSGFRFSPIYGDVAVVYVT